LRNPFYVAGLDMRASAVAAEELAPQVGCITGCVQVFGKELALFRR
jgi:hypothetical protein